MQKIHPQKKKVTVLTGAGISAESGIKTFRDFGGLWENHNIQDVATPEGFARNPGLVYEFYEARRQQLLGPDISPNLAHYALVNLEKAFTENFLLVTQNVDNLHERAGSQRLIHMHGEILRTYCQSCEQEQPQNVRLVLGIACPSCKNINTLRPDVVWFGEVPKKMEIIEAELANTEIFLSIGTSGEVYPAAAFVRWAKMANPTCRTIEVNIAPSATAQYFDEQYTGLASEVLPELVQDLIN